MRGFLQKQRYLTDQAQDAKFVRFEKQVQDFLDIADFFVTPLSDDWSTLESKGTRWGAFLVTKTPMRGGRRFSVLPDFFDPSRLNPVLISVPTGKVVTNCWLFVGSQDKFSRQKNRNELIS